MTAAITVIAAVLAAAAQPGVSEPDAEAGGAVSPIARARHVMGAPLEIRAFAPAGIGAGGAARAIEAALGEVERLDAVLSNWRSDSELARLNRAAARAPVPLSDDLFEALSAALAASAATGGAFDPALEPWVSALGLREPDDKRGPPPLPPRGGVVKLDPLSRTAAFTSADVGIDLGGIGKGYALDRAAAVLRREGIDSALLNFGGQVLAVGAPPGEPGWIVEVADPRDRFRPALALRLKDASAATSSNTERGVRRGREWIGHVLDPGSGRPAPFPGSATAVAPDATRADAYSTALLVMGPERGVAWAEDRADVAAVFLGPSAEGPPRTWATSSFERYREAERPRRAAR